MSKAPVLERAFKTIHMIGGQYFRSYQIIQQLLNNVIIVFLTNTIKILFNHKN